MKTLLAFALIVLAACGSHHDPAAGDAPAGDAPGHDAAANDAPAVDASADAPIAGARDPFTALASLPGECSNDRWCWKFPQPNGNRWFGVFGTGADNIWLYGAHGTIVQWDGQQWTWHHPPSLPGQDSVQWPWSISGTGKSDMWLILGSAVEHWNGATWTIFASGPINIFPYFHAVWTAPSGDVWMVSNEGVYRSRNGDPFELVLSQSNLTNVWGTGDADLFVSGPGSILRWNGTSFDEVFFDGTKIPGFLMGVANDAWASGGNNTLLHWNGTTWTPVPTGLGATAFIQSVSAVAPNDVWWFTSSGSLGESFLHWDGTSINVVPLDYASYGDLCCPTWNAAAIIAGKWWMLSGDGAVYTKDGADALKPIVQPAYFGNSMWGTSDTDMYFGSKHWDGTALTDLNLPFGVGGVTGVAHAGLGGANELFAISFEIDFGPYEYLNFASHFDGQTWTKTQLRRGPPGSYLTNVYAMGPGEAMAVGSGGVAFRFHDGHWTSIDTGVTASLDGIWGPDADHLWISGENGTLLQWSRASPDVLTRDTTFPATTNYLGTISGANGVMWIANPQTFFVSRLDQTGWSQVNTGVIVLGVLALDARDVVVTTNQNSKVARFNGEVWTEEDYSYETSMSTAFRPPNGHLWLTNGHGVLQQQ